MSQHLVLRLAEPATWVVTDAAGARIGPVAAGSLADAAALAADRSVVVIAPGAAVTLARPELPARSGGRLAQLVPYALEESLAGDVEQFHFAVGATAEDGRTEVAAVRRDELRAWLDSLRDAGIEPAIVVPDVLCLPANPGKIVAVLDSGQLMVRAPGALPVTLDAEPLTETFALAGLEGEDRHVQLYASQQDWEHSREMIEALREVTGSLDLQLLPDGALPLLAAGAVQGGATSLLQGEFARKTGWQAAWKRWRVAALLALAALLLQVGVQAWDLSRLRAEETRLDAAIEQAARIALPGEERIVDARAQIEQRLGGGGAPDPDGLLPRLAAVAGALSGAPGSKIEAMDWRDRRLDLRLSAPDTDSLARFAEALSARGLSADVQSTSPRESGVEARVSVSGGSR